jgi:hypothetical protein
MLKEDELIPKAEALARSAASDVQENHLANLIAHLKMHRDPKATRALLSSLQSSPLATRTQSTRRQFEALERHAGPVLERAASWQEAAYVLGWARRLLAASKPS